MVPDMSTELALNRSFAFTSLVEDQDRRWFVSFVAILLGLGILMVHSASITSRPTEFEAVYLTRHLQYLLLGLFAAVVAANIPAAWWKRLAPILFCGTLALLVLVLIPGVGTRVKGAQRWLRYGGFSLQPSEFAKLALPLFLCVLVDAKREKLNSWIAGPILFGLPVLLMVPLVVLEPDLGTALFLIMGSGVVLWLAGLPLRNFLLGGVLLIPVISTLMILKPYQWKRLTGFVAVWTNPEAAPYQIQQSLATLGAGGLFGVGLGKGWQKLSFLPEANTDFVFAVIGEELGLCGTLGVLAVWTGIVYYGWKLISPLERGSFESITARTLLFQLVFQAALNIAVVSALVPPKGISHPLVSYGGSNLLVSLIALGVILSLSRSAPLENRAPRRFG